MMARDVFHGFCSMKPQTNITHRKRSNIAERVVFDAEAYFDGMLEDISRARHSVDLESYIFKLDGIGERVISMLSEVAGRNVKVRLLIDGYGSQYWSDTVLKRVEQAGIELRVYHPLPWRFWQWGRFPINMPWRHKLVHFINNINRRNHRKTCLVDSRIVWIGSFNVTEDHLSAVHGGRGWRDTAVRLESVDLTEVKLAFEAAWRHLPLGKRLLRPKPDPVFRLNNSRRRRRRVYKHLLLQIARSQRRVWITNAYFVPEAALLRRLSQAARRGVDVRILLPAVSDVFFIPWASATFYRQLLNSGVRIYEYEAGVLHAKTSVIDDCFTVGSSNLNSRSLRHDLEIDAVIRTDGCRGHIERQFLDDIAQSTEIFLDDLPKRARWKWWIGRLVLNIRYWI